MQEEPAQTLVLLAFTKKKSKYSKVNKYSSKMFCYMREILSPSRVFYLRPCFVFQFCCSFDSSIQPNNNLIVQIL